MKKLFLYSTLFLGGVASIRGDVAADIGIWLTKGEDTYEVCQNIGKKGRLLTYLPQQTRDVINARCEKEFLGLSTKGDREMGDQTHPQAWAAVQRVKPDNVDAGASNRRAFLKKERGSQPLSAQRQKEQKIIQDAYQKAGWAIPPIK